MNPTLPMVGNTRVTVGAVEDTAHSGQRLNDLMVSLYSSARAGEAAASSSATTRGNNRPAWRILCIENAVWIATQGL